MGPAQQTNTIGAPAYLWDSRDPDLDDALHKCVSCLNGTLPLSN